MANVENKNSKNKKLLTNVAKNLGFPLFAIILAIFISVFFVMWAKNYSILEYFTALKDLFTIIWDASFGSKNSMLITLECVTPLIFTGVAHSIAFRTGLFNIGVEGQFMLGSIAAAAIGIIPGLNPWIHVPLIVIGGMVAGSLWAAIPGYLKAKTGANEVINTIMMNYIGMYFVNWVVLRSFLSVKGKASTPLIQKSAELLRFSGESRANISVFIAIACAILIFWVLWKTTIGYELRGVGINPYGAEYGGVSIKKSIILSMALSGAIAGIGGATHVAGILHQSNDLMGFQGFGFDGIAVALLAKSNPVACIASAVLFGILSSSSKMLQINGIPKEIVYLIQSIIIIFVATDYILKYFSEKKRKKEAMING